MAIIIKTDGSEETIVLEKETSLKTLQQAVGGYIELLHTKDGRYLICNEDGKNNNLPINVKATQLWAGDHDAIVGDVVICETSEMDSDDNEEE